MNGRSEPVSGNAELLHHPITRICDQSAQPPSTPLLSHFSVVFLPDTIRIPMTRLIAKVPHSAVDRQHSSQTQERINRTNKRINQVSRRRSRRGREVREYIHTHSGVYDRVVSFVASVSRRCRMRRSGSSVGACERRKAKGKKSEGK